MPVCAESWQRLYNSRLYNASLSGSPATAYRNRSVMLGRLRNYSFIPHLFCFHSPLFFHYPSFICFILFFYLFTRKPLQKNALFQFRASSQMWETILTCERDMFTCVQMRVNITRSTCDPHEPTCGYTREAHVSFYLLVLRSVLEVESERWRGPGPNIKIYRRNLARRRGKPFDVF